MGPRSNFDLRYPRTGRDYVSLRRHCRHERTRWQERSWWVSQCIEETGHDMNRENSKRVVFNKLLTRSIWTSMMKILTSPKSSHTTEESLKSGTFPQFFAFTTSGIIQTRFASSGDVRWRDVQT